MAQDLAPISPTQPGSQGGDLLPPSQTARLGKDRASRPALSTLPEAPVDDPVLRGVITNIINVGLRPTILTGMQPEFFGWFGNTRSLVIWLRGLEGQHGISEVPASDFMRIGNAQKLMLAQADAINQTRPPEQRLSVTFIADASGGIQVDSRAVTNPVIDNVAKMLVEQPAFNSQIMVLPGFVLRNGMKLVVRMLEGADAKAKDRFYIAGTIEEAQEIATRLNNPVAGQPMPESLKDM